MVNITQKKNIKNVYPLISVKERLLIWEKAKGIWKNRKPNPEIEMKKIRKEWERATN